MWWKESKEMRSLKELLLLIEARRSSCTSKPRSHKKGRILLGCGQLSVLAAEDPLLDEQQLDSTSRWKGFHLSGQKRNVLSQHFCSPLVAENEGEDESDRIVKKVSSLFDHSTQCYLTQYSIVSCWKVHGFPSAQLSWQMHEWRLLTLSLHICIFNVHANGFWPNFCQ